MHIAFVTPECLYTPTPAGGLANYVYKTSAGLSKRGHKVSVFVLSTRDKKWRNHEGVFIYEIKSTHDGTDKKTGRNFKLIRIKDRLLSYFKIARKVLEVHRLSHIDIIQSSNYLFPGILLIKNKSIPLVTRVSSYEPAIQYARTGKISLTSRVVNFLEMFITKNSDAKYSPSQLLVKTFGGKESISLSLIKPPTDINLKVKAGDRLFRLINNKLEGKNYLLYFGRLNREKGVDLLTGVLPKIIDKYPNLGVVFIGQDVLLPEGLLMSELIISKCSSLQKKNILFFAPTEKKYLYPVVKNAQAVLVPSKVDNHPNVVMEAMSLGVPAIATKGSSIDEVIEHNKTGFLASQNSPTSLYKNINLFLKMSRSKLKLMRANIKQASIEIEKEDRIGQLVNYYQQVVISYEQAKNNERTRLAYPILSLNRFLGYK